MKTAYKIEGGRITNRAVVPDALDPKEIGAEWIVADVVYAPRPDYDPTTHRLAAGPATYDGSNIVLGWSLEPHTPEVIASINDEAQQRQRLEMIDSLLASLDGDRVDTTTLARALRWLMHEWRTNLTRL